MSMVTYNFLIHNFGVRVILKSPKTFVRRVKGIGRSKQKTVRNYDLEKSTRLFKERFPFGEKF